MINLTCRCGKLFLTYPSKKKYGMGKYCSTSCRSRFRPQKPKKRNIIYCQTCKKRFQSILSHEAKYCSWMCFVNKPRNFKICKTCKAKIYHLYKGNCSTCFYKTVEYKLSASIHHHKRRIAQQNTDITLEWLLEQFQKEKTCRLCGKEMEDNGSYPNGKHLDHIIPLLHNGLHNKNNVRYICAECNLKRPKNGSDIDYQILSYEKK